MPPRHPDEGFDAVAAKNTMTTATLIPKLLSEIESGEQPDFLYDEELDIYREFEPRTAVTETSVREFDYQYRLGRIIDTVLEIKFENDLAGLLAWYTSSRHAKSLYETEKFEFVAEVLPDSEQGPKLLVPYSIVTAEKLYFDGAYSMIDHNMPNRASAVQARLDTVAISGLLKHFDIKGIVAKPIIAHNKPIEDALPHLADLGVTEYVTQEVWPNTIALGYNPKLITEKRSPFVTTNIQFAVAGGGGF